MNNLNITFRHLVFIFDRFSTEHITDIEPKKQSGKIIKKNISVEQRMYDMYKTDGKYILIPQVLSDRFGEMILLKVKEAEVVEEKTITEDGLYIIPTKRNPIFQACCDYFGFLEGGTYKPFIISDEDSDRFSTGATFATSYLDAINRLHETIKEDYQHLAESAPKCKFEIYLIDGTLDKHGETKRRTIYSISVKKCVELIWNK